MRENDLYSDGKGDAVGVVFILPNTDDRCIYTA
jgi:hypothetical protein